MRQTLRKLLGSTSGAVAPTIALSLFGLIAVGGIAFDYARLASMDTELQNAADQAALAGASQLDHQTGSCARAAAAAVNMVANQTKMANDAKGLNVTIQQESDCDATGKIRFWQDIGKTQAATSDANANFVEVEVDPREAFYTFTPIAAAFHSGDVAAIAFAGLNQAVCKVPPVMICNPQETGTNTDFDVSLLQGKGLRLVSQGGGSGSWAPGNYGYLDTNIDNINGAVNQLRAALGWGTPPGDCIEATGVDTKPGVTTTLTDALNTRFDIYANGQSCLNGGTCPPSVNVLKDVARPANSNNCAFGNGAQSWNLPDSYYGEGSIPNSATTPLPTSVTPDSMGLPRDMCHAVDSSVAGACTGPIGDGNWDRDAYFRTNYRRSDGTYWTHAQWVANTGLDPSVAVSASNYASRYNLYLWEIEHRGQVIDGVTILGPRIVSGSGANAVTASGLAQCGTGQVPSATSLDRRKFSVAVVNCLQQGVNGNSTNVQVVDWLDVFFVEPSLNRERTNAGDIYVEVIGRTNNAANGGEVQLVKKSVPYLIE